MYLEMFCNETDDDAAAAANDVIKLDEVDVEKGIEGKNDAPEAALPGRKR